MDFLHGNKHHTQEIRQTLLQNLNVFIRTVGMSTMENVLYVLH